MSKPTYAKHDKFIGRGLNLFGFKSRLLKEINSRLKNNKNLNLLEVGCGKGNLLLNLAYIYPNLKLVGINKNSTHGIKNKAEFKNRATELGLSISSKNTLPSIHFADATKLPFSSASFDLVISQVTLLHVNNKAKAIEEIYRVLKPRGIAIISLGSYSIRRKLGHSMPQFYKSLRKKLHFDFNPRFLIKTGNKFISLSSFFGSFKNNYDLELKTESFVSESQRGIAQWLILKKKDKKILNLGLKYQPKESKVLTFKFSKLNPVNWGSIDIYQLD